MGHEKTTGERKYDDIIGLPHHTSPTRPRMSPLGRAAQFAPFAALTGYDAAISETGRLTDRQIELTEAENEAALREGEEILDELCADLTATEALCADILRHVTDRIENSEKPFKE